MVKLDLPCAGLVAHTGSKYRIDCLRITLQFAKKLRLVKFCERTVRFSST